MASQSVGVLRGLARSENDISHDLDLEIKKKDHVPQTKWQKFRVKGQHCLHGKYVLMLVVALCILDCCLVITELILDIHAVKDALDIQHKADTQAHDTDFHESASNLTGTDPSNYHVTDRSPEVTHSVHRRAASGGGHALPITMEIAHGCHFASVAILGVLLVYVIFKVIFFGREMFGKKLEMFDAFVVLASFALDLAFLDGLTNGPIENTAFILSFFVPWRVLRVVNSLVVAILDHEHYKLVLIYKSKKRVEQTLDEVREELHEATNRVKKLKEVALQNGVNQWKINLAMVQASKHDGKKHALSSFASFTFGAMADKKSKEGKTSSVFSNAKPIKVPQLHEVEEGGNEKPDKVTIDGPSEPQRKERADTETSELEHTKSISGDSAVSLSLDAEQSGSTCSEVTEPAKNKDEEKDVGTEQNKTEKYVTVVKIPENEETGIEPKPDHSAVQISFDNPVNEDPEQLRRDNKALNSADRTISDADTEQLGYDNAAFVPDSSSTKL